jgi:hypothetical protein
MLACPAWRIAWNARCLGVPAHFEEKKSVIKNQGRRLKG